MKLSSAIVKNLGDANINFWFCLIFLNFKFCLNLFYTEGEEIFALTPDPCRSFLW